MDAIMKAKSNFVTCFNVKYGIASQSFDLFSFLCVFNGVLGSQAMASRGSVSRGSESQERCEALRLLLGRWRHWD